MKRLLFFLSVVSLALIAAAAIHVLILLPGDTGIIQCPGGVLTLVNAGAEQVEYICNDAPTATATNTPTATNTATSTETATATPTASQTPSATGTATQTPSATSTRTATATHTATASATNTRTNTPTATQTRTSTPTITATRTAAPTPSVTFLPLVMRMAVIGDSAQDEYRANDNRGAPYQATTFNWVELLANERGLNFGAWGTRAEPRRSGYEYMWARSGATTDSAWTQLNGVVAQINAGQVTHVLIQVGLNDFNQNNLGYQIYNGAAMTATLNHIADNIIGIANQANTAAPGRVLVAGPQDYVTDMLMPEIAGAMPDPVGRARLSAAFAYIDARIQSGVNAGVHYWDYDAALAAELFPRRAGNVITIGGQGILISPRGNEYHHAWLDESPYAHAGTALSGLFANLYISAINSAFGASIAPLSDAEIIAAAGG